MQEISLKRVLSLVLCAVMLFGMLPGHVHAEGADRLVVLSRQMNSMVFPVAEEYYDDIVDFGGCRGGGEDLLYGVTFPQCISADHAAMTYGNDGMDIRVPAWAEIYAPMGGMLYRSAYADAKLGMVAVIEQSAGNSYSYYVILGNVNDSAPVASGAKVTSGDVVAYSNGTLHFAVVMAPSGSGEKLASNASQELENISSYGWLTDSYGTGLICNNPSSRTYSQVGLGQMGFLDGPIAYTFALPPVVQETTSAAPAPTEHTQHVYDQHAASSQYLIFPASCVSGAVYATSCACGAPGNETFVDGDPIPHKWDKGTVIQEAGPNGPGQKIYVCATCGTSYTETLTYSHTHVYDQKNTDSRFLKTAGSCATGAEYYMSCICGDIGTETFMGSATNSHSWDAGIVTKQPTHTEGGERVFTCTVCGASYVEPMASSGDHVYDQQNTAARYLKNAPSCTAPAEYYMSCICGQAGTATFTVGSAAGHVFSDAWTANNTHHWHAALCEHTSEASGIGEHTWDGGKTTAQAGHASNGEITYTCTTCGYARKESIPGENHVFDREVADAKYLASPATCTQGAVYYKSCVCGLTGTETFVSGEPSGHTYSGTWTANELQHWQAATCGHTNEKIRLGDHIWDGGVVTLQPTETTRGERTFTCVVCGLTKKEALEPSAHQHTFATTWSGNDSYHWKAATCGHSTEMSDFGAHAWNGGVVTVQASHYQAGEVLYTCATCGLSKREPVAQQHTFDQRNASAQFLKSPATCTSAAVYYVSCSCGAKGTDTFTSGYAQGHSVSNTWSKDDTNHWRSCVVCGAKADLSNHYFGVGSSCTTCGYAKQDSHVHTSHLSRVPAKNPGCEQNGNTSYYVCECGKWFTDVSATAEITDPASVTTPATGHVDKDNNGKCDVCKERISTATVEYTIAEGADAIWLNTSNQGLVFRSNSDYSKFDHVEVDGSVISSMNYTVSSGSTIVELSSGYMKRLTIGQHKITIAANDGAATANFTIKQGTASAANDKGGSSIVWVVVATIAILALLGAAGVAGYILYKNYMPGKKKGGRFAK